MTKPFSFLLPLALLSGLLGTVQPAHAQNPAMSLTGSVQSEGKLPLAGAAITVIHLPSGVRQATASDGTGHFVIANLVVGGPYLIKVGEGGYRSQTVENIFLENGKTANFTLTLSKLGDDVSKTTPGKDKGSRANSPADGTLALAPEAVVGGPVLITTVSKPRTGAVVAAAPAPQAAAQGMQQVAAPAAAPRYSRYPARYPARRPSVRVTDPIVPGHYDAKSGNYIYDTGQPTTLKLANGGVIPAVGVNSTESYLYHFLADPQVRVDTVDLTHGWYNFDRVYFETGKASLTPESVSQLRNVATILHAYPKARIKLGGYTDSTGTYKVNKQLSEARARTAWASLVEMGVSPSRIDARGYGPNYAISANDTEEGRAKNRRLSVKVLQK